MKKYIIKTICLLVVSLVFLQSNPAVIKASGGEQRVYDDALLLDGDIKAIEQEVDNLEEKLNADVVVLTSAEVPYDETAVFADDYFDYNGFGTGEERSGILFLIDMNNREFYISTSGDMIPLLTDERIDSILDEIYPYASAGDYNSGVMVFLSGVEDVFDELMASGDFKQDEETGRIIPVKRITLAEAAISILTAAVVAGSACLIVMKRYKRKKSKEAVKAQKGYQNNARFTYTHQDSQLMDTRVTHRVIPKNPPPSGGGGRSSGGTKGFGGGFSSTHQSSSGRSHGGGGRKF